MVPFLSFKTTFEATLQIFLLGAIGFLLVKKRFVSEEGLGLLSRLVIEVTLPLLIFCQLIERFSFSLYPNWWVFPLLSMVITAAGFILGRIFLGFLKNAPCENEFLSLTGFQNSGYLPLVLIATILPGDLALAALNYLFLFLLGFNLVIWSFGVWFLKSGHCAKSGGFNWAQAKKMELGSLFSPPVVATLLSLFLIALGLNKFIPATVIKPLKMVGDCTLPLAMLVVGGSLAQVRIFNLQREGIISLVLVKLILLPSLALLILFNFKVNPLIGFLVLLQMSMPSATSLSLIVRHYRLKEDFINQGIFITHMVSLITIPFFLGLYGNLTSLF